MKNIIKLTASCLILFSMIEIKAQNLIQNGYFESSSPLVSNFTNSSYPSCPDGQNGEFYRLWQTTNLIGWQYAGTIDLHHRNHWDMGGQGNQHIDLNSNGVIQQSVFGLKKGEEYTLSFLSSVHSLLDKTNNAKARVQVIDSTGIILFDTIITKIKNNANIPGIPIPDVWINENFIFTAISKKVEVKFSGLSGSRSNLGVLIDSVVLCSKNTLSINKNNNFINPIKIYPNPSNGVFKIQMNHGFETELTYQLEVMDNTGKVIINMDNLLNNTEQVLDLSQFAKGFYTIKIISGDGIQTEKLILK